MANGSAPTGTLNSKNTAGIALLIRALTAKDPEAAHGAWQEWYEPADIDQLPWEFWEIIPAMGGRLRSWLHDDPALGIFQGVLRRAWTEAQIRLTAARSAIDAIERAGCGSVLLAGPATVSLVNCREGSVRSVPFLRLVVRRDQLCRANAALEADGWQLSGKLPPGNALDRMNCVFYSRNQIGLLLHWRLLPVFGPRSSACEAEFLTGHQRVNCCGRPVWIPSPEQNLLFALSTRAKPDPDCVPWQADAALLPMTEINWSKWSALAAAYAPEAFDRLDEMRHLGIDIPKLTRPVIPVLPGPRLYKRVYRSIRHRAARFVRQHLR